MADDVTLRFRLTGEDAGAGKALDEAGNKVEATGTKMKALGAIGAAAGAAAGGLLAKSFADNLDIGQGQAKLKAQLDLTGADAEKAGKAAAGAFGDNWGDSMDQVNEALAAVSNNISSVATTSEADLQGMTEKALALSQTFNVDVNESTRAAGQLMKTGLAANSTEAFDIITAGFQSGVDKSGDFLDTINEYSPQFAKLGISGTQALGILQDGLKAGARDTDAIADAFKEFSIRAIDGSKSTAQGFQAIGLDAGKAAAEIGKGGPAANAMTAEVLQRLLAMKDPVQQNIAGVALFGTQWEDTVRKTLPALAQMADANDTAKGSTDRMMESLGESAKTKVEGIQRSFQVWVDSLVSAQGPMGSVVSGVVAFGAPALAMAGSVGSIATGLAAMNVGAVAAKAGQLALAAAQGVATAAQWLFNAALTANPIGIVVVAIAALVAGLIYFFTKTELGRAIVEAAMKGISTAFEWVKSAWDTVWTALQSGWNAMISFITGVPAKIGTVLSAIWTPLKTAWDTVWTALQAAWNGLVIFVTGIPARVSTVLSAIWTPLKTAWDTVWTALQAAWNGLVIFVTGTKTKVAGLLGSFWAALQTAWNTVWAALQAAWNGLVTFVTGVRSTIGSVLSTFFSPLLNAWNSVKAGITSGIGGLIATIKNALNQIIYGYNKVAAATPGGLLPQMSYLATGGIVTRPTLAVIGEAGPEAVIPLSRAGGAVGMGGPSIVVNVSNAVVGNSDELSRVVITAIREAKARGLLVGVAV